MFGTIFHIKRYALHDGPGIRTTLFFKGCPLSCWWCHNPESQRCGEESVLRENPLGDIKVSQEVALGQTYSVDKLFKIVEKDLLFYEESDGGVTFSGGEPLMQPMFLKEVLRKCRDAHIHTTLDTSGVAPQSVLDDVAPWVDLFLYDIKHMDSDIHKRYMGTGNEQILANLRHLVDTGGNVIVRYPMIPGVNDSRENIYKMKEFLLSLSDILPVHILPYHRLGKDKYHRYGIEDRMPDIPDLKKDEALWVKQELEEAGFTVKIEGS